MHFERVGEGAALLVLHGLFGSLVNWRSVARDLASRLTVFSVDLRNHGRSPHAPGNSYEEMAADLLRFLDDRGLAKAHVLGHSMGGKVAMQLALTEGARVDRLIVADIGPRAYPAIGDPVFAALGAMKPATLGSRRQAETELSRLLPDPGLRAFLLMGLAPADGAGFRWRFHVDALAASRSEIGRAIEGPGGFPGPTLFLRGERSEYVTEEDRPAISRLFPAARIVTVPAAGHWLHVERREAFCAEILTFLGEG